MPTFGRWDDEVLEHTFEQIDFVSLHTYLNNYAGDTAAFLASPDVLDLFIDEVVAITDAVAARRRSRKRLMLTLDEWNVWYRTRRNRADRVKEGWPTAPAILEEIYTMEDALAFGGACISLLNHADRVKTACLAQLVNTIAPIMTETGGPAWRQTIFWPFAQMSRLGRGNVLRTQVVSETYSALYFDPRGTQDHHVPVEAPYLKTAVVADIGGGVSLFLLNRDLKEEMRVTADVRNFGKLSVKEATQLHHPDLKAFNDPVAPLRVRPERLERVEAGAGGLTTTLLPASWNVIRLEP
jgi:alpha-N-arabinofuranosidase